MRIKLLGILLTALFILSIPDCLKLFADTYQRTDKDGSINFSDDPPVNASKNTQPIFRKGETEITDQESLKHRAARPHQRDETEIGTKTNSKRNENNAHQHNSEMDIADGSTMFLDYDRALFGSFMRRFGNAVYCEWKYPQNALKNKIGGTVVTKITFNRMGELVHFKLLEGSGEKNLDEEVVRTLDAIDAIAPLPKEYSKSVLYLIVFFHYDGQHKVLK